MKKKLVALILLIALGLAACNPVFEGPSPADIVEVTTAAAEEAVPEQQTSTGMIMGPGSGMMARHHAPIPAEYAGISSPLEADEDSLRRGAELYNTYCVNCHGTGGMGDGPAGQTLDPLPAPIAHTSRMLGDDYMFWRVSEGGLHEPFTSAMPRWQDVMDETDRWAVISYVRALGSGQVKPGQQMGGEVFDPTLEAAKHAEMAALGVQQDLFSQDEADIFLSVHDELDTLMAAGMEMRNGGMENMQNLMLEELLANERINPDQAETFTRVHDLLVAAGLME